MTHSPAFQFFGPTEKALYLSRPNRFVLTCRLRGKTVNAFLPNPGRLSELLLPETSVYLDKTSNPNRSLQYTAVALEREGFRIVLHTHRTNDVARYLIESGSVPGLSDHEVVRREVTHGNSRFDFLTFPSLRFFHGSHVHQKISRPPPVLPDGPLAGEIPTSHRLIGRPRITWKGHGPALGVCRSREGISPLRGLLCN
jgi:hypothetical protein